MRPLSDPGARDRIAPFAGVAIIAVVLALLPPISSNSAFCVAAAVVTIAVIASAILIPWGRLADWCQAMVPLAFFIVIALLRHGGGGAMSAFVALVMLPILWMAIYGNRTQLRLAMAGTAVTILAPMFVLGAPLYPSASWRGSVLWVVIALLVGSATQRLVAQSRHRTANVAALGAVTRALTIGSDPRAELCIVARQVTGAAYAVLCEPGPDETLVATAGTPGIDISQFRFDPRTEVSGAVEAWNTGARIYFADASKDPRVAVRLAANVWAVAMLFEPVTRDGRRLGVLAISFASAHPRLDDLALDMVDLVVAEIASALDRADMSALLARQARTDPLTGAANRRGWDEVLDRELARARRTGDPLSVALVDIDRFKAYNDAFGHTVGDVLLRELVAAIRAELRTGDVVARWGGEEFSLVLPACDLDQARTIAERLLRVVPAGQTISIGLTQAGLRDTPRTVIERADRALYVAKDAGRNQVKSLQTLPAPSRPTVRAMLRAD